MTDHLFSHDTPTGRIPAGTTLRIALVGCGKTKLDHPAPARDLYIGGLFQAARRHVQSAGYDAWWILSARHGLVSPVDIVAPYDAPMQALSRDDLAAWAMRIDTHFRCDAGYGLWLKHGGAIDVDVFAGRDYADPLFALWNRTLVAHCAFTLAAPHEGLQVGERLAAFKADRAAA